MADPYRTYKFEIEIDGFTRAGFRKVEGLKRTTEVVEYREGGDNETPRKLPGQTKFENVTFERGKSNDDDFNVWCNEIYKLDGAPGKHPPAEEFRRRVIIYLKDKAGSRVKKWIIKKAWPCEYDTGSLDADSSDVMIEQLVICHEGLEEQNLAAGAGPFED